MKIINGPFEKPKLKNLGELTIGQVGYEPKTGDYWLQCGNFLANLTNPGLSIDLDDADEDDVDIPKVEIIERGLQITFEVQ